MKPDAQKEMFSLFDRDRAQCAKKRIDQRSELLLLMNVQQHD